MPQARWRKTVARKTAGMAEFQNRIKFKIVNLCIVVNRLRHVFQLVKQIVESMSRVCKPVVNGAHRVHCRSSSANLRERPTLVLGHGVM